MIMAPRHHLLITQASRFILVGGTSFIIDFGAYYILTRFGHFPYFLSRVFSVSLALIWNFTCNRYWTFRAGSGILSKQIVKYLIVIVSTSLANLGLMKFGVEILRLPDLLVLVVVAGFLALVNFILHRFWSFKI